MTRPHRVMLDWLNQWSDYLVLISGLNKQPLAFATSCCQLPSETGADVSSSSSVTWSLGTARGRSFINTKNRMGLKALPWGTPAFSSIQSEKTVLSRMERSTVCILLDQDRTRWPDRTTWATQVQDREFHSVSVFSAAASGCIKRLCKVKKYAQRFQFIFKIERFSCKKIGLHQLRPTLKPNCYK